MRYIACKHIPTAQLGESQPWKFSPEHDVPQSIRQDKKLRQDWIQDPQTKWNYWTLNHGVNEADRIQKKTNPPRYIHGFAADLDSQAAFANAASFIEDLPFKPKWIEQTLSGGGCRLVFEFAEPMRADDFELACIMLENVAGRLGVTALPGYDKGSADPTRLWSNGNNWVDAGGEPIPSATVFKWQKESLEQWSTNDKHGVAIPLDDAYKLCKQKFGDKFRWPADTFQLEDQGPTWWVPESQSEKSALIKEHGIYTFSAHAPKPFYPWGDPELLGSLVDEYRTINIEAAVKDVFTDGKLYYRRYGTMGNKWMDETKEVLSRHLKKNCGLSSHVPKGQRVSEVEDALNHIEHHQRVHAALPLLCYRPGIVENFNSQRILNVAQPEIIQPYADGPVSKWGHNFPFIAEFLDTSWDGDEQVQRNRFLMEFRRIYNNFLNYTVTRNAALFFVGPKSVGKTFLTTGLMGTILGGSNDPTQLLLEGNRFNADMCATPVWSLDDPIAKGRTSDSFGPMLKKFSANPMVRSEKKYAQGGTGAFNGVICVTLNNNAMSLELLPAVEENSEDKWHFYKMKKSTVQFALTENENRRVIEREAPYFLRWLLDWDIPADMLERFPINPRYGYEAYHHPELLDIAQRSSVENIYINAIIAAFRDKLTESGEGAKEISMQTVDIMRKMKQFLFGVDIRLNIKLIDRFLFDLSRGKDFPVHPIREGRNTVWRIKVEDMNGTTES